jgi:hypothetical protein
MEIQLVTDLPPHIAALEREAVAEGFRFLTRLVSEWHSGANRFDAPGECLMAAYLDQQLAGIGGLSVDPFTHASTGRRKAAACLRGSCVTRATDWQATG